MDTHAKDHPTLRSSCAIQLPNTSTHFYVADVNGSVESSIDESMIINIHSISQNVEACSVNSSSVFLDEDNEMHELIIQNDYVDSLSSQNGIVRTQAGTNVACTNVLYASSLKALDQEGMSANQPREDKYVYVSSSSNQSMIVDCRSETATFDEISTCASRKFVEEIRAISANVSVSTCTLDCSIRDKNEEISTYKSGNPIDDAGDRQISEITSGNNESEINGKIIIGSRIGSTNKENMSSAANDETIEIQAITTQNEYMNTLHTFSLISKNMRSMSRNVENEQVDRSDTKLTRKLGNTRKVGNIFVESNTQNLHTAIPQEEWNNKESEHKITKSANVGSGEVQFCVFKGELQSRECIMQMQMKAHCEPHSECPSTSSRAPKGDASGAALDLDAESVNTSLKMEAVAVEVAMDEGRTRARSTGEALEDMDIDVDGDDDDKDSGCDGVDAEPGLAPLRRAESRPEPGSGMGRVEWCDACRQQFAACGARFAQPKRHRVANWVRALWQFLGLPRLEVERDSVSVELLGRPPVAAAAPAAARSPPSCSRRYF